MKILTLLIIFNVGILFSIVLMFPTVDLDNPPIRVFYCNTPDGTQVTVVFSDEDHPNPVIDFFYDIYRFFHYGRTEDIESFYIKDNSLYFPDDYASVTSFYQTEKLHTEKTLGKKLFQKYNGDLAIYISTWNHMFSEKPLPGITYVPVLFSPELGCREDVEKIYSWRK